MPNPSLKVLILACATLAAATTASAQVFDAGKTAYQYSCAACHGPGGKGDGPLRSQLKTPPADLTVLAKKNNGVFPLDAVYEIIDGRRAIAAHGTAEMPIWGFRYTPSPNTALGPSAANNYLNPSYDPEVAIRGSVLAIVDYLNRIQER